MRLAEPGWLILLFLIPLPWVSSRLRLRLAWPNLAYFEGARGFALLLGTLPLVARSLAIACIAVGLARPQSVAGQTRIAARGVAIVVALDQSSSMNTADFPSGKSRVSRLAAAKETVTQFVAGRPDDLIGLVVFANYPDLACPLTLDHEFVRDVVRSVRPAQPGDDGTNLGDAIVWALDSLEDSTPKKKVLILLTDGRNSPAVPRPTDPIEAAAIAAGLGVRVHTIAIGSARDAEAVAKPPGAIEAEGPDLQLLERLAAAGGGRAFVATDAPALARVFATIDALEKSPVRGEVRMRYREWYGPCAGAALGLLLCDRLLSWGRARRLP